MLSDNFLIIMLSGIMRSVAFNIAVITITIKSFFSQPIKFFSDFFFEIVNKNATSSGSQTKKSTDVLRG
jgi:hypothetical protein